MDKNDQSQIPPHNINAFSQADHEIYITVYQH